MRLTDEQYEMLSAYETQLRTAVRSRWARFPGTSAMVKIHKIHNEVFKRKTVLNSSCSSCVLRLLTEVGTVYFADKAERFADKAEREQVNRVQVEDKELPVQEKVEVKTDKPKRGRKPKTN